MQNRTIISIPCTLLLGTYFGLINNLATANPNTHQASFVTHNEQTKVALDKFSPIYIQLQNQLDALEQHLAEKQRQLQTQPDNKALQNEFAAIEALYEQTKQNQLDFGRDIQTLHEDVKKIPASTERLKVAKDLFEQQRHDDAIDILDSETDRSTLSRLLREKAELQTKQATNQAALDNKSAEYHLLAKLSAMNYGNSSRIENTIRHYENALAAKQTAETAADYALFLHKNQRPELAKKPYRQAIADYQQRSQNPNNIEHLPHQAAVLNNFATLLLNGNNTNDYAEATQHYRQAVTTYHQLATNNPAVYLSYYANTLGNLSDALLLENNNTQEAITLLTEKAEIFRRLAQQKPQVHQPALAQTLLKLATIENDNNKQRLDALQEAQALFRQLSQTAPQRYLPQLAESLKWQLNLQDDSDKKPLLTEISQHYRTLTQHNTAYLQDLADNLLAQAEQTTSNPSEQIVLYREALSIYQTLDPEAALYDEAMQQIHTALQQQTEGDKHAHIESLQNTLSMQQQYAQMHPQQSQIAIAQTHQQLAQALADNPKQRQQVEQHYQNAVNLYRQAEQQANLPPAAIIQALSSSLHQLAAFLADDPQKQTDAERLFQESIALYRKHAEHTQATALADTLSDYAALLSQQPKRNIEAKHQYQAAIAIYEQHADSKADHAKHANALSKLASLIQDKHEKKAEQHYRQAIKLLQALMQTDDTAQQVNYRTQLANAQNNLALLLANLKNKQQQAQAIDLFQAAIKHYRLLAQQDSDQHTPNLSNTLGALANTYIDQDRSDLARPLLSEATTLLSPYTEQHPLIYGDKHAYFLMLSLQTSDDDQKNCQLSQQAAKLAQNPTLKNAISKLQKDMKHCKKLLANK